MDNKQATLELGTKSEGRLLWQYAVPAIIAMLASSLYNMVDSIFIGQGVGPMAISGLAVTFPFMNLTGAFGAALGIGSSTLISLKLGQKDYQSAGITLGNTLVLTLIVGIGLSIVCLALLDPILYFFGASDKTISYARDYMQVILLGNVVTHTYLGLNAVLRAASMPRQAMASTLFTVVLNTILDPIFIYPWGLGMGIRGAAVATILAQVIALIYQFRLLTDPHKLLHLHAGIYKLRSTVVRNIIGIGVSPFAMNACACLVVIFCNNQLMRFGGDFAVGAFGISNKIAFVFIMIVFGLNQGMQPIVGYNYGARNMARVKRVVSYTIVAATLVTSSGWLLAMGAPYYCVRLFTDHPQLIDLSIRTLRVQMIAYPIVGFQMVTTFFFQCIGKVKVSIFLSLSRQLIFLVPLMAVLPRFFELKGVWWAMPSSDTMASLVTVVILLIYLRKLNHQVNGNEQ